MDTVYKVGTANYSKLGAGEFLLGLGEMIEELSFLSSEEKQDWIGCILAQNPANDCELLRSVDYCADQLQPKQPLNSYSEDTIKHFANYLASQLVSFKVNIGNDGKSGTLVQNEGWVGNAEKYSDFCYEEGKCPGWYYHFVAGDTYLEIVYQQDVGAVSGDIVFSVIGAPPKDFQIEWETQHTQDDDPQRVDIACRVTFDFLAYCGKENSQHTLIDDLFKAILVYYYWSKTDETALGTNKYNFEGWWIKQLQDNLAIYIMLAIIDLLTQGDLCPKYQPEETSPDYDEEGGDIPWDKSPLLIFTVNPDLWRYLKHPEYFDHISLGVDEDVEIKMKKLTVRLNNITISFCSDSQMPPYCESMTIRQGQPMRLDSAIEQYRLDRIGRTFLSGLPEVPRELLTAAAKNIGQAWDYGYASRWNYYEEEAEKIWEPRPIVWCSEYVCRMIEKGYTELPPMSKSCENLGVCPDMWEYFGDPNNDNNPNDNVRISPFDWNPKEARKYEWSDLYDEDLGTSIIKPGYHVGMSWKDEGGKGDKIYHSTFFVNWVLPPDEDRNDKYGGGKCWASFYGIGGNQGGGKITVAIFTIKNEEDTNGDGEPDIDCSAADALDPTPTAFWGDDCNFFAKTYKE